MSVIVLGNKSDLKDKNTNIVNREEAIWFIKDRLTNRFDNIDNEILFFETSAKTGKNVNQVFKELELKIFSKYHSK